MGVYCRLCVFVNGCVLPCVCVCKWAYLANDGSKIIEKEYLRDPSVTRSNNDAFQDHVSNIVAHSIESTGDPKY